MTEQQADRLRWAFDQNAASRTPHIFGPRETPRVYHVREHRNGFASLDCTRCRRAVIVDAGGGLTGSASTIGCLL